MSYLYAIQMKIPGYPFNPIKIGFSTNPNKRKESYTSGPFPTTWVAVWPGTKDDERAIHEQFKDQRLNGEWFLPTQELIDVVNFHVVEEDVLGSAEELVEQNRQNDTETDLEIRERLFGAAAIPRHF